MTFSSSQIPGSADNASSGRLDSWKEIASYLGKVERTVKRWEVDRALPVHRPPGGRGSVYAFTWELDEWLKSARLRGRGEQQAAQPAPETSAPTPEIALPAPEDLPESPSLPEPVRASQFGRIETRVGHLMGYVLVLACLIAAASLMAYRKASNTRASSSPNQHARNSIPPADPDQQAARDLYLKGRYEWNQRTPDSLNRALDFFTQAINRDPGYAPAYAGLADTYDLLREYTTMPDRDAYSHAIVAARKAVELDDSLAEAHRALAFAEMYGNWDFIGAEKEFHRAIELDPKDPIARKWYANAFAMPGRFDECLDQINKAQELDPSSHSTLADKGWFLFNAGRTNEGIELLKEVERSAPNFNAPHHYLMFIDLQLHNYPAFLEEGRQTAELANDATLKDVIASARLGYQHGGERGLLRNLYAKQKKYYLEGKVEGTMLAKTCVMMGRRGEALQLLEEAYRRHESFVLACLILPDLLTLKDDARYKALVKKINFPAPSASQSSGLMAGLKAQAFQDSSH